MVIDVFHGVAHDVATRVRNFVIAVVPHLHSVQCNLAETPGVGMDMACRVLCEAQPEHFCWANEVANGVAAVVPVNFSEILGKVQTHRVSSLCPLPSLWCSMVDVGAPTRPGGTAAPRTSTTAPSPGTNQGRTVTAPAFNTHAERSLLQRFRDSNHSTISSMMSGQSLDIIPKLNGNPVCLTWALKGECSHGCRRANQHVRYNRSTNQAIHALMDTCGVAAAQP